MAEVGIELLGQLKNNENLDMDSCAHLSPADRNHVAVRTTHLVILKLMMMLLMPIRMRFNDNYDAAR